MLFSILLLRLRQARLVFHRIYVTPYSKSLENAQYYIDKQGHDRGNYYDEILWIKFQVDTLERILAYTTARKNLDTHSHICKKTTRKTDNVIVFKFTWMTLTNEHNAQCKCANVFTAKIRNQCATLNPKFDRKAVCIMLLANEISIM